jgi:crotonobetainyl-CoA:carnitine CoA-transferase CaiB-like acyl-CoA transferase
MRSISKPGLCDKADEIRVSGQLEEIVAKLRQVDVPVSQVHAVADAERSIGVTEVTYYRWR